MVQESNDGDEDATGDPGERRPDGGERRSVAGERTGSANTPAATPPPRDNDRKSDSELSSLFNEPAPKKRRPRKTTAETREKSGKHIKKPATKSSKAKNADDVGPNEVEIKRLQGWLAKCGIKMVWHKELARFDNSKDKIRHLRAMLADAGISGRFSIEKAKKIKERRELEAEVDAARKYASKWGKEAEREQPRGRLIRGVRPSKHDSDSEGGYGQIHQALAHEDESEMDLS